MCDLQPLMVTTGADTPQHQGLTVGLRRVQCRQAASFGVAGACAVGPRGLLCTRGKVTKVCLCSKQRANHTMKKYLQPTPCH